MAPKCWPGSQSRVIPFSAEESAGIGFRALLPGPFQLQTLSFRGRLPDLNTLIDARMTRSRAGKRTRSDKFAIWNKYSDLKRQAEQDIGTAIIRAKLLPVPYAVFCFSFTEATDKRDPDNVAAGGIKLILDSLVRRHILPDDSQEHVLGVSYLVRVAPSHLPPHISVEIYSPPL